MGASKSDFFTQQQNQTADIFKALGHPARIAIIEYILSMNTCICGDLVEVLPLSQATVSQHLRELKNANIIQGTIEGNGVCYCLNEETIKQTKAILEIYIESSEKKNTGCC